jgi:hypothetical protein
LELVESKGGRMSKKRDLAKNAELTDGVSPKSITNYGTKLLNSFKVEDKYGFMDEHGTVIIPPRFDVAGPFVNGLARVIVDYGISKYGYINKKGEFEIAPQFDDADNFSEGLAAVEILGKWGYINKSGKIVISDRFDHADSFSNGLATVRISKRFGYIDKSGEMVIPARFDHVQGFSEGLAAVEISKKWGYINKSGEMVIPARFEHAQSFFEGLAAVSENPDKHDNVQGQQKSDRRYPTRWESPMSRWGYIDKKGHFIIPLTYWIADDFLDGIAAVTYSDLEPYDTFGFINTKGKLVIDPSFQNAYSRRYNCKWAVELFIDDVLYEYAACEGVTVKDFIRIAKKLQKSGKLQDSIGNGWIITKSIWKNSNTGKGKRLERIKIYDSTGDKLSSRSDFYGIY